MVIQVTVGSFASPIFATVLLIPLQQTHAALVGMKLQWPHSHLLKLQSDSDVLPPFILAIYHDRSESLPESSSSERVVEVPDEASESDALGSKL